MNNDHNPSNNFLLALAYAARIQGIPFLVNCEKIQPDYLTFKSPPLLIQLILITFVVVQYKQKAEKCTDLFQ
jgi:hypothetical protein